MAIEIEQPFGDDANDLPIELYLLDLEKLLIELRLHKLPKSVDGDTTFMQNLKARVGGVGVGGGGGGGGGCLYS